VSLLSPLYALLKHFEGLRLKPYLCAAGVPTIGYGTTRYEDGTPVTLKDKPITEERAQELLEHDTAKFVHYALLYSPSLFNKPESLCAVASFIYNVGQTAYKASTLRRKINAGEWEEAGEQFLRWNKAGGRVLRGLTIRRQAERELFLKNL